MNEGFLFIANGRVVPKEQEDSLEPIRTGSFEAPAIYAAYKTGWKIYMGYNRTYAEQIKGVDYDITFYNQHIYRNIFDFKNNYIAYKNLCKFLEEHPDIEVIHCNTPIGGVLGRICGHKYGKTVIYTAHGFHFFKGAPLLNITIFKWIELWMAHYTDILITINHEDYVAAQRMHLKKGGKVVYIPGVGMNTKSFDGIELNKPRKRSEIGVPEDAFLGIVVGDLNDNKNVETLIKAIAQTNSRVHIIVCGFGPNEQALKVLCSSLDVTDRIFFLGYRNDMKELLLASDFFLMGSKREGLPRSTMEAMCASLPCVCSKIRGNVDLIKDGEGGFLISPLDDKSYSEAINKLCSNPELCNAMGAANRRNVEAFSIEEVKKQMVELFKSL